MERDATLGLPYGLSSPGVINRWMQGATAVPLIIRICLPTPVATLNTLLL